MNFISKLSRSADPQKIVEDLTANISGRFDVAFLFVSSLSKEASEEVVMMLKKRISIGVFVGCTCAGVVGSDCEIEQNASSVLMLAQFPRVKTIPFYMRQSDLEGIRSKEELFNFFDIYPTENPVFLVLPDPFMFDMNSFLRLVNKGYPQCSIVGGVASGAFQPGENILILNNERFDEGLVGVILSGDVSVSTVVSQGCRPIGETFIVTKAKDNVIYELAGKPFIDVLQDVLHRAPAKDKLLAQESLMVGIAMDEYRHEFKRGDFLIRGVVGIDRNSKAAAIADYIRVGQTVQFHVRDAQAATEDLEELLAIQKSQFKESPRGALVFSCNGRGLNLFKEKDHDIQLIQRYLGPVPAAGFFCAGEIGPVCKINFLHGFTNSIALFYPGK